MAPALALLLLASSSYARPFTIEDHLHREDLGAVEQAGQTVVVERRGPTTSAARYDLDALQDIERSTLWVADLAHPGASRPLFPAEHGAGYALGPVSPDGRRVAVMRLTDHDWELGVASPTMRQVHWLGVTPEMTSDAATVVWRSNEQLMLVARERRALPRNFRYRRVSRDMAPDLWRITAKGGVSTRVFDSGPGATRRLDLRKLVAVDVRSSRVRTLAAGTFIGLTLSPNHRQVALLVEGRDHPMSATHPIQDTYGFEANERHLQIIGLDGGASISVGLEWDVLPHPLAWSEDGRELMAFGRNAIVPWTDGRFLRIDAATGAVTPVGHLRASLDFRPEAARAGWFGGDPVVWGVTDGDATPRWWRLAAGRLVPLTVEDLGIEKDGLTRTPAGLVAAGRDGMWRLSPGAPPTLVAPGVRPISYPQLNRAFLFAYEIPEAARVIGRRASGELVAVRIDGVEPLPHLQIGAEVLHPSEAATGLFVRRSPEGGELDLDWVQRTGPTVNLLHLNPQLADLDAPITRSIHHVGPGGQLLTSWLLLPLLPVGAPPPPLIVRPYPGSRYPTAPSAMDSWRGGPDKAAALLAAHGYAVLAPSLPIPEGAEPAQDLAKRVLAIIDQAKSDPELQGLFDADRLGVWGESFGGWGTLTMISQTDRFRAAVAEASMSDLVSEWGQYETFARLDPNLGPSPFFTAGWVEDLQGGMHNPPWADPERYLRNSPIFHADRVTTPLLLVHGEQDAFSLGQPEEMFSALNRQDKPAQLVVYWGEGHAIASPGSLRDLYLRVFRWFDDRLLSPADGAHQLASLEAAPASSEQRPRRPSPTSARGSRSDR
ncbi:S9 family peptidase [Phenylobacterium sp.]|uniref:S9 family peptidase n=1 Tax=Phenylobacterium sp. TaxID=1871053 RepID=UPI002E33B160|nr:prolyl oligopeptidase family serine peptidase [Phenylobacterium sp.]HEX3365707.1 prolyl oligopeptidase family serine peptidase [Phenylobacterium sp.]